MDDPPGDIQQNPPPVAICFTHLQQHLHGGRVALAARPVHRLGALDPVARRVHGHAPGHQVAEHLGVAVERGPVGRRVAPLVPETQRLATTLVHGALERVVIAALDGVQQRLVPPVFGAVHVQRVGRTPVAHAVVAVVAAAATAHHRRIVVAPAAVLSATAVGLGYLRVRRFRRSMNI